MALVLAAAVPAAAGAQMMVEEEGVELGVDAQLSFAFDDPSAIDVDFPVAAIRAGFPFARRFSFEPALGFNWTKVEDADAVFALNVDVGALYHFSTFRSGVYLRPRLGFSVNDVGDNSVTQFAAGVGLGTKIPFVDPVLARAEAFYRHSFENDDAAGANLLGVGVGISLFTR
jgi:hypothetical protein